MSVRPVESSDFVFRSPCEVWKRSGRRCTSCQQRYHRHSESRPPSQYRRLRREKICVRCTSAPATRGARCIPCYDADKAREPKLDRTGAPRKRFRCTRCEGLGHMAKTCPALDGTP